MLVLRLSGTFGADCRGLFESELERAHDAGPDRLELDLRGLTFIDSAGLQMILRACDQARDRDRELAVVRGRGQVERAFALSGLEQRLPLVDEPSH